MTTPTVALAPLPRLRFVDNNGNALSGGKLFTYVAGSSPSTKQATYVDSTGATPNTNPIILDSRGEANVWLDTSKKYKFTLAPKTDTDPPTNSFWTVDNISSPFNEFTFSSVGDLKALDANSIPDGLVAITLGYYTAGDGGGNIYFWNPNDNNPDDGGGHISVSGGGGKFNPFLPAPITTKQFGAKGNNSQDDTAFLNNAIQYCIVNQIKLVWDIGSYKITSPLLAFYFVGGVFTPFTLEMEGEKFPYGTEGTYSHSVRIVPTFSNLPPIMVQAGRNVKIKNIVAVGLNTITLTPPTYPEMMTNASFVVGGCRDSRYSPYAGIAIDPFGTSVPADGGYPGMSSYYVASAVGSIGVILEGVLCKNFVCGTVVSPSGASGDASGIVFRDCDMTYNKTGVSTCQGQSKNVEWYGGNCAFNLYNFDGQTYGLQQGPAPKINGCNMSGKYLFNVDVSTGNPLRAADINAANFASIGFLGNASGANDTAIFVSGNFSPIDFGGVYADHFLIAYCSVKFSGGRISNQSQTTPMPWRMWHLTGMPLTFDNASFDLAVPATSGEFAFAPSSGSLTQSWVDLYFINATYTDGSSRGPTLGTTELSDNVHPYQASDIDRSISPFGQWIRFSQAGGDLNYNGGSSNYVSLGSKAVTVAAGGTATFTATDPSIVRIGDLIYTTTTTSYENFDGSISFSSGFQCIGVVNNIQSSTITVQGVPQSLATGTYTLYKFFWPRYHPASTGDINTSTTIKNISVPSSWQNGNAIRGTGIPAGAYIVSGGGTTQLVISSAATSSTTGIRLYDADIWKVNTGNPV